MKNQLNQNVWIEFLREYAIACVHQNMLNAVRRKAFTIVLPLWISYGRLCVCEYVVSLSSKLARFARLFSDSKVLGILFVGLPCIAISLFIFFFHFIYAWSCDWICFWLFYSLCDSATHLQRLLISGEAKGKKDYDL